MRSVFNDFVRWTFALWFRLSSLSDWQFNCHLRKQIFQKDEEALSYLKDIEWAKTDDPKGFKLDFFFNTNPYFKNSVLTKIYHMIDEQEEILEKATG